MDSPVLVRPAERSDAEAVAEMARRFHSPGRARPAPFSARAFLDDGFGSDPAFSTLVAEAGGGPRGYAIYFWGYDPGTATRGAHLAALYVDETWRRRGIGGALMRGVARRTGDAGGRWVFWAVFRSDRGARRFYRSLAHELAGVTLWAAHGRAFDAMAASGSPAGGG